MNNIIPLAVSGSRQIAFTRQELDRIMSLYGRMVAAGLWRDYALELGTKSASRWKLAWTWGRHDARHTPKNEYRVPFASGRTVRVGQAFNGVFSHTGENAHAVDFDVPVGTPVHAARAGRVVRVVDSFEAGGDDKKLKDRVNLVFIRHADGTMAEYAHLAKGGVRVRVGQDVKAGQLVALSGNTGYTTGPHLHFMVFRARNGSERESLPFLLRSREGVTVPQEGEERTAP